MIQMKAETASLRLEREASEWTKVFLSMPTEERYIGAEQFRKVRARLLAMLRKEATKSNYMIEGEDAFWAMTLSEEHTTLYAVRRASILRVHFQDKNARRFFALNLNDEERESWIATLDSVS